MAKGEKKLELDPKGEFQATINVEETLKAMAEAALKKERLYFDLLTKANEYDEPVKKVTDNLLKLSMDDQILLLNSTCITGKICTKLCEKYNFDEECEEVE